MDVSEKENWVGEKIVQLLLKNKRLAYESEILLLSM